MTKERVAQQKCLSFRNDEYFCCERL